MVTCNMALSAVRTDIKHTALVSKSMESIQVELK
jgi:hypothetical protein